MCRLLYHVNRRCPHAGYSSSRLTGIPEKETKTRFSSKDKRVTELELSKGIMNILAISLSPRSTKASIVHLHALSRCPHLGRLSHCSDQKCVLKMSKLVLILPIVLFNFRLCCVSIEDHI